MKSTFKLIIAAILLAGILSGCSNEPKGDKVKEKAGGESEKGEHAGGEGEGEEDGSQFGIKESYEGIRRGVHMTLAYDAEKDGFVGVVKNTTGKVISQVRVEVHLSNGVELGPTPRADLAVGESRGIFLAVEGNKFESWSTHAESGEEEGHGSEGEGGEHGNEGGEKEGKEGKGEHR